MFIQSIHRKDATVIIRLDSNLGTCRPHYPMSFDCGDDQGLAELLVRHFSQELEKYQTKIAREPYYWLKSEEISKLKSYLNKKWDGRNHCWK